MTAMRDEAARHERTTSKRRCHQNHLWHRFRADVTQPHALTTNQPQSLEAHLQTRIGVKINWCLIPAQTKIASPHHNHRHAIVDQRDIEIIDPVAAGSTWQQSAAHRAGDIVKDQRHGRRRSRHTVNGSIARIGDDTIRRGDAGSGNLAGIAHENANFGDAPCGRYQPTFDGKGTNTGKNIAAILGIGDKRLIDKDLQEQIVDIGIAAHRPVDNRNLRGERRSPAHAINLAGIGRAHDAQQESIARVSVRWQISAEEIAAL